MQEFKVNLDQFEGPLDLMIHLISQKKLDLFDLKIDILIDQYISYLDAVEDKLSIASEYLAELANLIEYKSKKLLPKELDPLVTNGYEEDSKETLIKRILEYQRFKEISQVLNNRFEERALQLEKPLEKSVFESTQQNPYASLVGDPQDLIQAMHRIMQRFNIVHPQQVRVNRVEISIDQRTEDLLLNMSTLREPFTFDDLIQDCDHIHLLIVTFLSLLEMTRKNQIAFEVNGDEIWFRKGRNYGFDA